MLVHGTFENRFDNWQAMAPALKAAGYCVYSLNYGSYNGSGALGIYGVGEIERSAGELRDFVASVRARTGAAKVSLVGHSQGGLMPRYFIKHLGGAAVVDDLVGLAPSNHGTSNPFAPLAGSSCPACRQQVDRLGVPARPQRGRRVARRRLLHAGRHALRRGRRPVHVGLPRARRERDQRDARRTCCPNDTSDHLRVPYDAPAIALTLNALGRTGPADPAFQPPCCNALTEALRAG